MGDNNKKKKKGEERVVVMEKEVIEIDLSYSPLDDKDEGETGTPVRPIFCLKNKLEIKEFEEKEDCFILEFDPNETLDLSTLSVLDHHDGDHSPDLSVLAEKGQVACRDFPHSRHSCVKYPFEKTSHESYCELCYCFVCDISAPCKEWKGMSGHCHAINNEVWKAQRKLTLELLKPKK